GHDLELGAALPVGGGPLVVAEPAGDGHLAAFGQVLAAGGGEGVEGDDVDEVGGVLIGAAAGDGEAEGGGLVLLSGSAVGVGGQAADELNGVHGVPPTRVGGGLGSWPPRRPG